MHSLKGCATRRAGEAKDAAEMTMTPRQRITAALQHRQPDRTPMFEYVLQSPLADVFLRRPYAVCHWQEAVKKLGWAAAVRQAAVDQLDLAQMLGHDMLYVVPNAPPPGPRAQETPAKPPPDDPVERVRLRNRQVPRRAFADEQLLIYAHLKDEMTRRGVDLPILAPAWFHGVWTDVDLMQTMLLAPQVACEHFALATQRALACVDAYARVGIDMIGVGGDFAGNRPIISPEAYRRFIAPEVAKVTRRIHEADSYAVNASDGNLWPVIDDFLIGCGVDGYAEIDFHAGMDLRRLKAAYGRRITFFGNLDCGSVLSFGSPQDVRRHVIDCIEAGAGDGGHVLCASNAITASVPLANYLAAVNAYRDFFGIPKLDVRC